MGIGDIFQLTMEWQQSQSVQSLHVQHYIQTAGTTFTPQDVVDGLIANWETAWASIDGNIANETVFIEGRLSLWDSMLNEWNEIASGVSGSLNGTSNGPNNLQFASAVISFKTPIGKRTGKKFVFGLTEDTMDDGILDGAVATALGNYGDQLALAVVVDDDTFEPCTFARTNEVTSIYNGIVLVNLVMSHQTRRRIGVGN